MVWFSAAQFLKDMPFSLLVTSLALAASALPVSTTELTKDNFATTVSNGLWFIEHFSPYCHHCISFKPTWDELVIKAKKEIPSITLAQVDCIMQGDLCNQNDIKGYPTMKMFDNGKIVSEFKGARDIDRLMDYLKGFVKEALPATTQAAVVQKKTQAPPPPRLNLNGEVEILSSTNFHEIIAKGPAFVKFYAPWCGHCKKLAPTWKKLANKMQGKLTIAEVNCDDHSSLCKGNNVQGYPTLIYFNGGSKKEYNGGRTLEQLGAFSEKAASAGVEALASASDLDVKIASDDVLYLLLHASDDEAIINRVGKAAEPLFGSPAIYSSSDPSLFSRFEISQRTPWTIIALKDHDAQLPTPRLDGAYAISDAELTKWLLSHRLPSTIELTQDTFQHVMNAEHRPLVVIAATPPQDKEKVASRLREVAKKWRSRTSGSGETPGGKGVVWAYMDAERWKDWLKSMYGIHHHTGSEPSHKEKDGSDRIHDGDSKVEGFNNVQVVIADHKDLVYWDTTSSGQRIQLSPTNSLFSAVEDAAQGRTVFKHSESRVERFARFLNDHLTSFTEFVAERPFQTVFYIAIILAVIVWVMLKISGNPEDPYSAREKHRRLD